jgi:hypothetical protein
MNVKIALLASVFSLLGMVSGFCQHDSIVLKKIRVVPDTVIEGVRGIGISYVANLGYDTTYHLRKFPSSIKMAFELKSKGRPVECSGSSSKFCKKDSFYYAKDLSFGLSRPETVLIPFYALKLPEGNNSVSLVLTGMVGDTSIFDSALRPVPVIGKTIHPLSFVKPPVDRFEVLVSGVKLMGTDFKGKDWDYNLISGAAPDICWKVTVGRGESFDVLFRSSVMKNAYSAAWLDWVDDLALSRGDEFCIAVYDDDPLNDDFAGSICGTLPQIVEISKKKQPMTFDRLSYFTFMINGK